MNPKVSIIVPVYKVENYIRRCLDSIENQIYTDWECLLIDDGTPDKAGEICDEYAHRDDRFRVFHQENQGVSAARNKGLDEAKGEWIGFVDADDSVTPDWLSFVMSQNLDGIDVVQWGCYIRYENIIVRAEIPPYTTFTDCNEYVLSRYCQSRSWLYMIKRDLIQEYVIKFPLGIKVSEDQCFLRKVTGVAQRIQCLPVIFHHYYQVETSASHNRFTVDCAFCNCDAALDFLEFAVQNNLKKKYVKNVIRGLMNYTFGTLTRIPNLDKENVMNRYSSFLSDYQRIAGDKYGDLYLKLLGFRYKTSIVLWRVMCFKYKIIRISSFLKSYFRGKTV